MTAELIHWSLTVDKLDRDLPLVLNVGHASLRFADVDAVQLWALAVVSRAEFFRPPPEESTFFLGGTT